MSDAPAKSEWKHEVALRELEGLAKHVTRLEGLCQQIAGEAKAEPSAGAGPADPAIPPLAGFLAALPTDLEHLSKRLSGVDTELRGLLF